ncbi:glycosyl transferase family 2 [bacterium BMS3Abin04]|nr:glycosyl transferase family 2 [bacterium BMS3Abin04]
MKAALKISSIIIAKNEAENISRCIESQINCIDEIIVLIDKDSNDKTTEIVKSFPKVKWEIIEWMGYGKTKQYGVDKSENEWILWIDADEAITPELATELNNFKCSTPSFNAYKIARKAYFLGKWIKHSGWYPGYVARLFNKKFARFSLSEVHEHLLVDGTLGKLNNDLEHYTDPNIFHYYEKFNRYTSLAASELEAKGKSAKLNDLLIRPFFIFIKMYILKRGFLDGIQGFILAVFSANYVFTKYSKLWELKNKTN